MVASGRDRSIGLGLVYLLPGLALSTVAVAILAAILVAFLILAAVYVIPSLEAPEDSGVVSA